MLKKISVTFSTVIALLLCGSSAARAQVTPPTPSFAFIAPGWTNPPNTIDMTQFWAPAGLPETGINTYLSGGPLPGNTTWERFDPLSPFYQVWFGTYVVQHFAFASEWDHRKVEVTDIPNSIARVMELAVIDQIAWLTGFRDPAPLAQIVPETVHVVPVSNGYFAITADMLSHSDVGNPVPFPFVPPPSPLVGAYDPVTLDTFLAFKYDAKRGVLLIVYASGTKWVVQGVTHHTPFFVSREQISMILGTQFE